MGPTGPIDGLAAGRWPSGVAGGPVRRPHRAVVVDEQRLAGRAGRADRPARRQLPVPPPALRRPDAQAAAPGGGRRLRGRDADQPEQPRARRRTGDGAHGEGGGGRASPAMFGLDPAPRPPDQQRDDGQPRGAVRGSRAAPASAGVAYSTDSHYTHARMCHVLGVESIDGRHRRRAGASTSTRLARRCCATGRDRHRGRHRRGRPAWAPSTRSTEIVALAGEHGVRVHVDAAYGGFFRLLADGRDRRPRRGAAAALAGDRRGRLGRGRPAQARPAAVRLRGGAVRATPTSAGSTRTTRRTRTSPPTSSTSARSAWSARGPGAAAAALWLTLQVFPLTREGLGGVLAAGRRAAVRWHALLDESDVLRPLRAPRRRHRHVPAPPGAGI